MPKIGLDVSKEIKDFLQKEVTRQNKQRPDPKATESSVVRCILVDAMRAMIPSTTCKALRE